MNRNTLLMLAVLASLAAGSALAAEPGTTDDMAPAPKSKPDANADGSIDRAEAAKYPRLAERFDQLDKNQDGRIDKSEMPDRHHRSGRGEGGSRGEGARDAMVKLDTDKDGRISRAEAAAGEGKLASRFDEMDANKDGYIDRADHELRAKKRTDEWFAAADTDRDGKLSRSELDAAKGKREQHRAHRSPESKTPAN